MQARDQSPVDISEEPEQQPDTGLTLTHNETSLNAKGMTLDYEKGITSSMAALSCYEKLTVWAIVSDTAAQEKTDGKAGGVRDDLVDPKLGQYHHSYDNVSSVSFARQVNGDTMSVKGLERSPRHRYKDVTAKDSSREINGNVSDSRTLKLLFSSIMNVRYRPELQRAVWRSNMQKLASWPYEL